MKHPIIVTINETYEINTPMSLEIGDGPEDQGFSLEKEDFTIEELIDHIEQGGFIYPSAHPVSSVHDWVSSHPVEDRDYFERGAEKIHALHLVQMRDGDDKPLSAEMERELWIGLITRKLTVDPTSPEARYGKQAEALQGALDAMVNLATDLIERLPMKNSTPGGCRRNHLLAQLQAFHTVVQRDLEPEDFEPDPSRDAELSTKNLKQALRALATEVSAFERTVEAGAENDSPTP